MGWSFSSMRKETRIIAALAAILLIGGLLLVATGRSEPRDGPGGTIISPPAQVER